MFKLNTLILLMLFILTSNAQDFKRYHKNGNIKKTGRFENGRKVGVWKEFYENGKLHIETNYVTKSVKSYYENSQLKEIYTLDYNEHPFGEYKMYYDNGNLLALSYYKKGGTHSGEWKIFHKNGQLEHKWKYNNGTKNGQAKQFFPMVS